MIFNNFASENFDTHVCYIYIYIIQLLNYCTFNETVHTYIVIIYSIRFIVRRKDNIDNGMVVAEIGLPSGFVGDISKTTGAGLEHKETTPDAIILYFKNVSKHQL